MKAEDVVRFARKAVYVIAFLVFMCIPVGKGRENPRQVSPGWAPMILIYIGGWGATFPLVIAFRICVTIAVFKLYKLVTNNDHSNSPRAGYGVFGFLSLSFTCLLLEMLPLNNVMLAVFVTTLVVCGLLAICDTLTLRWLAKIEKENGRQSLFE